MFSSSGLWSSQQFFMVLVSFRFPVPIFGNMGFFQVVDDKWTSQIYRIQAWSNLQQQDTFLLALSVLYRVLVPIICFLRDCWSKWVDLYRHHSKLLQLKHFPKPQWYSSKYLMFFWILISLKKKKVNTFPVWVSGLNLHSSDLFNLRIQFIS